jgi:SAM-dependent methyltransferase
MDNYDYCASWALRNPGKILDYGCGAGQVVTRLRAAGREAFGCDVFFEGGDYSNAVPPELFGTVIKRMDDRIPFDDASFDVVINNFVMEHVPDIDKALGEIRRVLKPGGVVLSLFPDRTTWRENHCLIPFLHRFKKGGRLRVYYAALMTSIGFGSRDPKKESPLPWAKRTCAWLDEWTYYRTPKELRRAYGSFSAVTHIEHEWLAARFGERLKFVKYLPEALVRYLVRRIGANAIVCTKP